MELSLAQKALIHFLKKFDLERETILVITLMLSRSERGMEAFIYVSQHAQITKQEEFLKLASLIAEDLPSEERTGEVFDPPIRIKVKH